jgi:hypothetical protein
MTDYNKWAQFEKELPEDEEEGALRRLREQKESMSHDEVRRLHECWEKPEFKQMFQEYADEVSDPAHKAEQEQYLAQVEAEQRMERDATEGILHGRSVAEVGVEKLGDCVPGQPAGPEGSQLIRPTKGFVIKTWKRHPGRADFDRDLGKVFINVCTHSEIDAPSAVDVTSPDGRRGQSWSLPHLVSPKMKEEKDKQDHVCTVLDIVFNPLVMQRTEAPNGCAIGSMHLQPPSSPAASWPTLRPCEGSLGRWPPSISRCCLFAASLRYRPFAAAPSTLPLLTRPLATAPHRRPLVAPARPPRVRCAHAGWAINGRTWWLGRPSRCAPSCTTLTLTWPTSSFSR